MRALFVLFVARLFFVRVARNMIVLVRKRTLRVVNRAGRWRRNGGIVLTRRSVESTHLTTPRLTPVLGVSSAGSGLFVFQLLPIGVDRNLSLFHLRRCADRFSIHRQARRGPVAATVLVVVTVTSPHVSPSPR